MVSRELTHAAFSILDYPDEVTIALPSPSIEAVKEKAPLIYQNECCGILYFLESGNRCSTNIDHTLRFIEGPIPHRLYGCSSPLEAF
jgi:hypothetical protein